VFFVEKGKNIPKSCIVIFKDAFVEDRGLALGLALGIGYKGSDKRIIPISASDIPDKMDALETLKTKSHTF
jgi:hypothetical protein